MSKSRKRAPAGHTRKRAAKKEPTKAKAAKKTARKRTLKQPPLPTMEQVRHVKLDGLCESIGDGRDRINALQADVDGDIQAALDYMLKHKVESYHHHGLEVVLRPGSYKLSVRKHKEMTATMPADGDDADPTGGVEVEG